MLRRIYEENEAPPGLTVITNTMARELHPSQFCGEKSTFLI